MKNNHSESFILYPSWKEAKKDASGYDHPNIIEKVKDAALQIKETKAVYERDSVLFDTIQYSWPLLTSLMLVAAENSGNLNIIDFGGSLGSTFFQNRKFLRLINKVQWNIVEQEHYVKIGKSLFETDALRFFTSVKDVKNAQAIIFSSVLQYLEDPFSFIESILQEEYNYILIDRTAFTTTIDPLITLEVVPPSIYNASYPAWFFNESEFIEQFKGYTLIESFDSYCDPSMTLQENTKVYWKGFILKRNKEVSCF